MTGTVHPPRSERPTWEVDDTPADARAEHDSPEESPHLLRAELDACRAEIERLRRWGGMFVGILVGIWPDVDERWSCNGTSDSIARMLHDGVLNEEQAAALRELVDPS